jgi:integrase
MARPEKKLSAKSVMLIKEPGRYADGGGLYLSVSKTGTKSWLFIYRSGSRRPELGLGSLSKVTLAAAREKAETARRALGEGKDPKAILKPATAVPTFGEEADDVIEALAPGWKNAKHRDQWKMTLKEYCKSIRGIPVNEVTTEDVLMVLKPLWTSKTETASRLRGRVEAVLASASAKGHRSGMNPAQWRNHLDKLLPRPSKLTRGHHAAMSFKDVPEFVQLLRGQESVSAMALEFLILCASRSGEVLGARWAEIDLEQKVWTIPAARMKAGKEHRVPLSNRAIAILQVILVARTDENPYVFPGRKARSHLSNMALEMVLRRLKIDVTVHGFRSSFRDWGGDATNLPREVIEQCLAHQVGDEVERAYRRGDALEKRREVMEAWSDFCEKKSHNVINFGLISLKQVKA